MKTRECNEWTAPILGAIILIVAWVVLSCSTHIVKSNQRLDYTDSKVSLHGLEYYCSEVCFKDKNGFFTGKMEINSYTGDVICYCKQATEDPWKE